MVARQYLTRKISDPVAGVLEQWAAAEPDLATGHLAVVARLHRLAHALRLRGEEVLEPYGLTQGEFDVLSALRRSSGPEGMTPSALAASVLVSSGGMTKRLASLERAGWIARSRSERDARSVRVALTPAALERLQVLLPEYFAAEADALDVLDDAQRDQLADLLRVLSQRLDLGR
jgi:DNA-binding MarR family transcriptional regulator